MQFFASKEESTKMHKNIQKIDQKISTRQLNEKPAIFKGYLYVYNYTEGVGLEKYFSSVIVL